MLSIIFNTCMYSAAIYFGAKYYNLDIDSFLLHRAHEIMFMISFLQIKIKNSSMAKYIQKKSSEYKKTNSNDIEVIKCNKVIYTASHDELIQDFPNDFDFIIYNYSNPTTFKIDKNVFDDIPSTDTIEYAVCSYSFIQIILSINETTHKINLNTSDYNYYNTNNRLNRKFLGYYLYKHSNYDMKNEKYNLMIMDQDAKILHLTEKDEIIFDEDNYTIVTFKDNNEILDE